MSKLSDLIFHNAEHYMSSKFGYRNAISTSKGKTSTFHNGVDYATYSKKLAQYAIADGVILSCGTDIAYGGAKFVWVKYPDLGVKMFHYHLDSVKVKKGQSVNKNTILGYTGKTGKATGIHLHLGCKKLSGGSYIDPESWFNSNYKTPVKGKYSVGNYKVTTDKILNVRKGAGTKYAKLKFNQLSESAQLKILKLTMGKKKNGYVKGLTFTVQEVAGNWGKTGSGWVCLDYCKKI